MACLHSSNFFQESQTSRTGIFWNVCVLLVMPATWLAWQVFFFFFEIYVMESTR